ncbi:hypothetical protein KDL01_12540 [Actinospica durhamensis]|uniref:Secreted protein n=1 Tax=Actinospica durhamensis TaxID=1508375 RepID=A0A941ES45_9ACTN|nr:hypothetical protein [Actinospica durhamensis]MBR7834099.1 hypothetical protein [Actinospica durhamensis]
MGISVSAKAVAVKTARWSAVPVLAVAAFAVAAGPALADSSSARVSADSASVFHGQVTVGGVYECGQRRGTEQLRVTVIGQDRREQVEATRVVNVNCGGSAHGWRLTLGTDRRNEQFTPGLVRVEATLGDSRDRFDRASTTRTLFARGI